MSQKPDLSIVGETYNNLKVNALADKCDPRGKRLYECTCLLCGNTRYVAKYALISGRAKDCENHNRYKDISGMRFGKLTVLYLTDKKSAKNKCRVWHCACDCGSECDVISSDLLSGNVKSCGCLRAERVKELFVDGTAPCKLVGGQIRSTNVSGATGVWFDKSKSKWRAEITLRRKKYRLGAYDRREDAVAARKRSGAAP